MRAATGELRLAAVPVIERPDRIDGVAAVGVDETAFLRARPGRSTVFATGIVDLHGGKLIDITEGRSRKVLADWLIDQPTEWVAGIQVAALDPFRGYGAALSAGLPHAVRVLDAFHVVRLGFAAVDDVRRRVQQHTCGHRGRHDDPLDGIRRVLRRGAEHLTTTGWARLLAGIEAGDHDGQVAAAWVAAQELRAIYRCRDRDQASARIDEISYKRHHKYFTVVVDHDSGRLVWAAPGRDTATVRRFFDALGAERCAQITHVSADAAEWISDVVAERCPTAIRCADPLSCGGLGHRGTGCRAAPGLERRAGAGAQRG